ncbi:vacuolar ATPase assembly protein VMA22 [Chanos chanos]|uniref:Vacuolar ATPase assembly protein VMA22 n=1 Tax=Chanos chanos TaxID=29144 RepID=A0A6J2V1Q9_CHACN|nr:coiled-coil domain-containing protein 115 [Chanos chanos]
MGLDPKQVSLRLDQQLLRFMDQLEALEEKRERLNSLIEQGWFSISKARYSMGNKQVSALQYASEMEPLVHVHTRILDNGVAEFQAESTECKTGNVKNCSVAVESIGPNEEGLRRRINMKQKSIQEENVAQKEPKKSTAEREPQGTTKAEPSEPQHQDPLKWFGILVPQNLKQAQGAFKEVITLSAEIATLQNAILATRTEMQTHMKEKQKILIDPIND